LSDGTTVQLADWVDDSSYDSVDVQPVRYCGLCGNPPHPGPDPIAVVGVGHPGLFICKPCAVDRVDEVITLRKWLRGPGP
jgi:hypothetical protein